MFVRKLACANYVLISYSVIICVKLCPSLVFAWRPLHSNALVLITYPPALKVYQFHIVPREKGKFPA